MIESKFVLRNAVFEYKAVTKAVDQSSKSATEKSLAAVKERMLDSLKRGSEPSRHGQPPTVHSTSSQRSLRNIGQDWDDRSKSGVVGSVLLPGGQGPPLPGFLESGGTRTIVVRKKGRRINRRLRMAARPYAGPALESAIKAGEIISPWSNVVSG